MQFEWDEIKNQANALKHGIYFEEALEAFADPDQILVDDLEHSTDAETRYRLIGRVLGRVVLVVFTIRRQSIRMISARPASREERIRYEQGKK